MLSKKWLINICLAAVAVFFGVKAYDAWNREVTLPEDTMAREAAVPGAVTVVADKQPLAASNYDVVVEKDLFAPERKEIIVSEPEPEKNKLSKVERRRIDRLSLLGVVMTKDRKTALIQAAKSREDPSGIRWVVEGDEVEGMRVVEIKDEKILLSMQDQSIEVLLYDPEKPKNRGSVKKEAQPTVMSTGDTPAAQKGTTKAQPAADKRTMVTPKKTTQTPKVRPTPPRFGPPALRKKKES